MDQGLVDRSERDDPGRVGKFASEPEAVALRDSLIRDGRHAWIERNETRDRWFVYVEPEGREAPRDPDDPEITALEQQEHRPDPESQGP